MVNRVKINIYGKNDAAASPPVKKAQYFIFNFLFWNKNMQNAINWFEIPTTDINRAQQFYETIFGITMMPLDLPNIKMRMFPLDDMMTQVGGALVYSGGFHKASATDGPLI